MKRPLVDENLRWMMIHAPDSFTASWCRLSLALRKLGREMLGALVVPLAEWAGVKVKQPYRKYLKNTATERSRFN